MVITEATLVCSFINAFGNIGPSNYPPRPLKLHMKSPHVYFSVPSVRNHLRGIVSSELLWK